MGSLHDADLVRGLSLPSAYPHPVGEITTLQTHISRIFFAGDFVYKVKKPLDTGYLDFRTLDQRRHFCEEEVRLNRRLSPDVYVGVCPVYLVEGSLQVREPDEPGKSPGPDDTGEPIEYAVKMRRLPGDRSLEALVQSDALTAKQVGAVARAIARFHSQAERPDVSAAEAIAVAQRNLEENIAQTAEHVGHALSPERYDDLSAYCTAFLDVHGAELGQRASEGRFVEGHGDLHSSNVFLNDDVQVIDCIEFNRRFRVLDAADEIAFILMDLERLGRADLSAVLEREYSQASPDDLSGAPMGYYRTYRAWVRGKVTATLADSGLDYADWVSASGLARRYFELAHRYVMDAVNARPRLIAVTGLIGCGKSTLTGELSRRWGIHSVSSDVTRKRLAGISPEQRGDSGYEEGIYSPDFTDATYYAMFDEAKKHLARGASVVLDASFARSRHRAAFAEAAREAGADAWLLECVSTIDETRSRLARRAARPETTPSDARWETYLSQRTTWEHIGDAEPLRHAVIDSASMRHETVREALGTLFRWALSATPNTTPSTIRNN
jgi:uncharacterized protein